MRGEDVRRVADALAAPMKEFVRESRVRTALLVSHSGQVLAQHGFTRSYDTVNVASLAAATHSSSHALAELTGAGRWVHLHHAGSEKQLFLAPFSTPSEELVLVAIFDRDSTLGLVRLFFDRLTDAIRAIPELGGPLQRSEPERFETDLEAGLQQLLSEGD